SRPRAPLLPGARRHVGVHGLPRRQAPSRGQPVGLQRQARQRQRPVAGRRGLPLGRRPERGQHAGVHHRQHAEPLRQPAACLDRPDGRNVAPGQHRPLDRPRPLHELGRNGTRSRACPIRTRPFLPPSVLPLLPSSPSSVLPSSVLPSSLPPPPFLLSSLPPLLDKLTAIYSPCVGRPVLQVLLRKAAHRLRR